jgi:ATP-dependent helicase/DNAse subunit B
MFGRGGRGGWRGRGRGCGPGGAGRGFMGMMKNFMEKMGGEEQCKSMKQDFCNTMKHGSEVEKKEQWEKFGKVMEEFGQHMGTNAEGMCANA